MEEQATLAVEASVEFVGRWQRLVSTTNWEKGRIISEWREALRQSDAPAASFTDEAWSRQVGNVTSQHVGRLRRVHERFGEDYQGYNGLYWSHFFAALDWPDAEMYLEGAVQNGWSVPQMRQQRWEATGGPAELRPRDADVTAVEWDQDAADGDDKPPFVSESFSEVRTAGAGDETDGAAEKSRPIRPDARRSETEAGAAVADAKSEVPLVRPFEALPPLPSDVAEAFDLFKLAILNHKVSGWQEIARQDVLSVLESLKQLVLAPAE